MTWQELKREYWNKRIVPWWHRLWVRRDEFHSSLDMDARTMIEMTQEEQAEYRRDLVRRREIAHQREMARSK